MAVYCEAHPHVRQMYPCDECMADYYAELDSIAAQTRHHAAAEAAYYQSLEEEYHAYLATRLYRDKCLEWLNHNQHNTDLPDWYYYA